MGRRRLQTLVLAVALAGAGVLVGTSSVVAALSQENSVRLRLSELPRADRAIQISYRIVPQPGLPQAEGVEQGPLKRFGDVLGQPQKARFWDPILPADERGIRIVELDNPRSALAIVSGRQPRPCRGQICEAVSFGGLPRVGKELALGKGVRIRLVGRGRLDPIVMPDSLDPGGRYLAVHAQQDPLREILFGNPSLVVGAAELVPERVHGYALDSLRERLRRETVQLDRRSHAELSAPVDTLERLSRSGTVARERLLVIAGQGAALLLAFAAFAAAARREDIRRLADQLETLGASRVQMLTARAIEAAVPVILGLLLALAGLRLSLEPLLAAKDFPRAFIDVALPSQTIATIVALTVVGGTLLFASFGRRRTRFGFGALELAALTALGVIVWQTLATSALDPDEIARGESGGPILLLLPALSVFAAGILFLRLLPPLFRLAERLARGGPFGLRLALLAAARNPARIAAATTFLGVALGSALFSLSYRTTLDHQARDAARFEAGARVRVIEHGAFGIADVSPLTRFATVTRERPTPVLHLSGVLRQTGRLGEPGVTVIGVPPEAIARLASWRNDFSALSLDEIARRLRSRGELVDRPLVPPGAEELRMWARRDVSVPRSVELELLLPGERFERLVLGVVDRPWRLLRADVPRRLRGARLVGISFPLAEGALGGASTDEGTIDLGPLEARQGQQWAALTRFDRWTTTPTEGLRGFVITSLIFDGPIDRAARYGLAGGSVHFIRPRFKANRKLPALVSPAVGALAVDGLLTVEVLGQELSLRSAGEAELFPTVTDMPRRFVVIDYRRLFTLLNLERPGLAPPSEVWFFGAKDAAFRVRLGAPPFRVERVVDAKRLEQRLRGDPLARGAATVLLLGGLAGAVLAVFGLILATRSDLVAERQLLAEYEALGVPPSSLARSLQLRLILVSLLGIAASLVGGLLAVQLTAAFVAVTATAGRPLPPIEPATAWLAGGVLLAAVAAASVVGAARQASVFLRQPTGARLRA